MTKPEGSQKVWIIAGYILALLGGLIGLFIGLQLLTYKKTLPNGDIVHVYSELDRKHGLIIIVIGVIMLTFSIVSKFMDLI